MVFLPVNEHLFLLLFIYLCIIDSMETFQTRLKIHSINVGCKPYLIVLVANLATYQKDVCPVQKPSCTTLDHVTLKS
jgi:hypothetical protein